MLWFLTSTVLAQASAKQGGGKSTKCTSVSGQKQLALILANTYYGGDSKRMNLKNDAKALVEIGKADAVHKLVKVGMVMHDYKYKYSDSDADAGGAMTLAVVSPPSKAPESDLTSGNFMPPLTLAQYKSQMVTIPAGNFLMGENKHLLNLQAYKIGKTDVTVGMWKEYCGATGKAMPELPPWGWQDNHPIVNVSWDDAKNYCNWAKLKLPSEAQWEKASRGTDGREYPWGNDWDGTKCVNSVGSNYSTIGSVSPVGSIVSGASPYGCFDMSGNVWQWCEDKFDLSIKAPVVRGGAWDVVGANSFRCADRNWLPLSYRNNDVGFRCASL